LLLAACSAGHTQSSQSSAPESASPSPAAPSSASTQPPAPDLAVTVLQQRVDAATRMVGVDTTNREHATVHVAAVRLSGAGLDGPVTQVDADLLPKLTVALRTSYGRPSCDDRSGPVVAHLQINGRWIDYAVNRAGQAQVRRLLDSDCAALALRATAAVRLSGPYSETVVRGQPYLRGRLLMVRRSAGDAVDLRSLAGTVLIDLRPVRGLVDLAADADRATTPVLLGSTGRCDPHGLGQATQTFLLSAYVKLGPDPEQRVILTPPKPVQSRVLQVVDKACGTS
jgi:hypothetical protein